MAQLVNIGFGNLINADRLLTILNPEAAPVKRIVQKAKSDARLIDATQGRRCAGVLIMDSGDVVLSYLRPERLAARFSPEYADILCEEDEK